MKNCTVLFFLTTKPEDEKKIVQDKPCLRKEKEDGRLQ